MIFNNDIIFIHVGKTGGMSCSRFLLENLKGPLFNCHRDADKEANNYSNHIVSCTDIDRHCSLEIALDYIKSKTGKSITDFKKVFAVVRHPYTLEYSFYNHLKKQHVIKQRANNPELLSYAQGTFEDFVVKAGFHWENFNQIDFVTVQGVIPQCVELIKFETLSTSFPDAVSKFLMDADLSAFSQRNATKYNVAIDEALTPKIKKLIVEKHKPVFDYGLYRP